MINGGAPHLDSITNEESNKILEKININSKQKILLLATSNYANISLRISLVNIFCDAMLELKNFGWHGIIKLHPSDNKMLYKEHLKKKFITFFNFDELSKNDSFIISDIFCFFSSAIAFESLINQKNMIVINVDDNYLGEASVFIKSGNIPVVKNSHELIEVVKKGFDKKMKLDVMNFNKKYFFKTGEDSSNYITLSILDDIKDIV